LSISSGASRVPRGVPSRNSLFKVDLSVGELFNTMPDFLSRAREMLSPLLSTASDFLSRAREIASLLYFYNIEIIISKLLSVFRSTSTIGTASSFFSLLTSLRSNKYNYVLEINKLTLFP